MGGSGGAWGIRAFCAKCQGAILAPPGRPDDPGALREQLGKAGAAYNLHAEVQVRDKKDKERRQEPRQIISPDDYV